MKKAANTNARAALAPLSCPAPAVKTVLEVGVTELVTVALLEDPEAMDTKDEAAAGEELATGASISVVKEMTGKELASDTISVTTDPAGEELASGVTISVTAGGDSAVVAWAGADGPDGSSLAVEAAVV